MDLSQVFIHTSYNLAIVHSQFVLKVPKGSLEMLTCTWPPQHKEIPTELCSAGVPLIAERIIFLLNAADLISCLQVCTTWNYQVSSAPKFMNKVSSYRKKYKENAENHHVSEKQIEFVVSNSEAATCYLLPSNLTQIHTKKTCSADVPFKCIKPVWHESGCSGRVSPSKRSRQSDDICCTKKSKKRLHRL